MCGGGGFKPLAQLAIQRKQEDDAFYERMRAPIPEFRMPERAPAQASWREAGAALSINPVTTNGTPADQQR